MRRLLALLLVQLVFAGVLLNFDEVEIKVAAEQIARLLGKNVVVDPRVRGKITLISVKEVSPKEAFELFSQALAAQGYAVIDEGKVIKVVPTAQGVAFTRLKSGEGGEFVTMVFKLKRVNASQTLSAIRPFLSPYGKATVHAPSNAVIVTDFADSVEKVKEILALLDRPSSAGQVRVYELKFVSPSYALKLLSPVSTLSTKRYGEPAVFSAVEELNKLVVYARPEVHEVVKRVLEELDTPEAAQAERSFYILPLSYISAEELYESLKSLFQGVKTTGKKGRSKTAPSITTESGMRIGIDKRTNALILFATRQEYEAVKRFVEKLDVRRKQVLITATVVEASAKKVLESGVRWQILGTQGGAAFKGSSLQDVYNAFKSGQLVIGAFSTSGTTVNVAGVELFFPDLVFLFSLLETGTGFRVVSNPKVLTLDNQPALIKVGQVVPFPTGIKYDVNGNPIITYDYKDVGLKLNITPRITGSTVRLVIDLTLQEITGYLTNQVAGVNYTVPITSNRELNSDVVVENGQTVVIGGLISRKTLKTVEKVPGLGDVPLVGRLFRYDRDENDRTSLFIFLTPFVVSSPEELSKITQAHQELARKLVELSKKREEPQVEVEDDDFFEDEELF
ncbi:MAG: type II secretion system secretin GspD [Aquificae bacterium]|nr:type II secretion system secretin GspD [Aquificota bacterium]